MLRYAANLLFDGQLHCIVIRITEIAISIKSHSQLSLLRVMLMQKQLLNRQDVLNERSISVKRLMLAIFRVCGH